jgi:pyrroloquinoline quinone (PQQ) biosynthesis protein C
MSIERFLEDLEDEVRGHPAVNHIFLARCATTPFTREDYKIYGMQHYPLVGTFTYYMEQLLVRAPDSHAKMGLAKVLVAEYGEGSDGKDHRTLYREFLTACGVAEGEENRVALDPAVVDFIREHVRIARREPFLVGLGALGPGHEWAIPLMFPPLIEGLRRAGFAESEIRYFPLHCEQDVDHARFFRETLARYAESEANRKQIRRGMRWSLDARDRFWTGVQRQVVRWRQPRSVSGRRVAMRRRFGMAVERLTASLGARGAFIGRRWIVFRPQLRYLLGDPAAAERP